MAKYDVFISYSRRDKKYVHHFVQLLRNAGFNVWIDTSGIHSTEDFKSRIVDAITESTCFIFFSSKFSNRSIYSPKEVGVAVELKKPIIPIKLDKTSYASSILFDLVNIDYIDASTNDIEQVLKRAIVALTLYCDTPINDNVVVIKHKKYLVPSLIATLCVIGILFACIRFFFFNMDDDSNQTIKQDSVIDIGYQEIRSSDTAVTIPEIVEEPIYTTKDTFDIAIRSNDWATIKELADRDYSPAFIPLANHYMKQSSTHHLADKYAKKALSSGYRNEANKIINQLKEYHFYD